MADVLASFEAMVRDLGPKELAELDEILAAELTSHWLPNPGPQTQAYLSDADLLLYGGAAGGGKTDLLLGLATTEHRKGVIFRRAYVDLRGVTERLLEIAGSREGFNGQEMVYKRDGRALEFGALEKPGAEMSWQGRDHDFIGFDEGAQLAAAKVQFVIGWLRSAQPDQRCRIVIASNPPMGGEGEWLIEWFAPWLDPLFPNPAAPGELRWAIIIGTETRWVEDASPVRIGDETYTPLSRTFIPAMLDDNPYLRDTNYRAQLQNMPEPLRSQLLHGDFLAGRNDHEWQVIPSEWVRAANRRWLKIDHTQRRKMLALAADVCSPGGADNTALAPLYDDWVFGKLTYRKGIEIKDPSDIALLMLQTQRDGADLSVDGTGGWGSGVKSHLKKAHELECESVVFSAGSTARTKDGKLEYLNLRAQMYWQLREALDPEDGDDIALPPDPRLTAELTTPRYKVRGTKIQIEDKDEIKKRVGSSPDASDAVVIAWLRRNAWAKKVTKKPNPKLTRPTTGVTAWMT